MQTWLSWIVLDQSLSQIVVKRLVRATVTSKLDWGLLTHLAVGCRPPFLSIWASPLATWVSLQHCNWLSPSEWPKLEIKAEASVSSMAWCQVIYHHLCLIMLVIQASPGVVWEWTTQRYRIMRRRWPGGDISETGYFSFRNIEMGQMLAIQIWLRNLYHKSSTLFFQLTFLIYFSFPSPLSTSWLTEKHLLSCSIFCSDWDSSTSSCTSGPPILMKLTA